MELLEKRIAGWAALAALALTGVAGCQTDYASAVKAYRQGDFATAYREYRTLAEAGDVRAQGTVACMLQAGEGVTSSPEQALPWYQKAAEKGLEPAQFSLAKAYENGLGTGRDLDQALLWYGKAAQQGNVQAKESLQRLQNPQKVAKPIEATPVPAPGSAPVADAAAGAGSADVARAASGDVMPELVFESHLSRQKQAAASGDVAAQLYVGWCYSSGQGVEQDKAEAIQWYRLAAQSGSLKAQLALGWMYFSGDGGKKDLAESALWYRRAAAQGDVKARQMVKRIAALK